MKRFVLFILSAVISTGMVYAQNAASIMQAARDHAQVDSSVSARSRMVITARNGTTSERVLDQFSKRDANGLMRSVMIFQSPSTVRGTRFLSIDNASGSTDQWIFLPNVGRVRRIASSESGGNFMGSDFSYDDMSQDRDINIDTYTILREETLDGAECYVIQQVPNDPASFQYSKVISWIDKTNNRIYKQEMYDKRGVLAKVMEISGFQNIQGRDTRTQVKLSTVAAGTSTTMYMDIVKYDEVIPEGIFTTAYLESGRVR